MFKEKYLIFKEGEPAPAERQKAPDSKAALSQQADIMAEDLTKINSDQILLEIFGANLEEAKIDLAENYLQLKQSIDDDSRESEYDGLKYNGKEFVISWQKNGKTYGKTLSSYLPSMEPAKFDSLILLFSAAEKNKAIERAVHEFCTKQIGTYLAKNGYDELSYKNYMVSYMVRVELIPVLTAAYKQGSPYEFKPEEGGFTLTNANEKFPEQKFVLADYNEVLNLKNPEDHNATAQQDSIEEGSSTAISEEMLEEDSQNTNATMMNDFRTGAGVERGMTDEEWQWHQDQEELESYQEDLFPDEFNSLKQINRTADAAKEGGEFTPELKAEMLSSLKNTAEGLVSKYPELKDLHAKVKTAIEAEALDNDEGEDLSVILDPMKARAEREKNHRNQAALDLYEKLIDGMGDMSKPE